MSVILSISGGGCVADTPPRQRPTSFKAYTPRQMAFVVDGMHPTGIHSCYLLVTLKGFVPVSVIYDVRKIQYLNILRVLNCLVFGFGVDN